MYSAYIIHIELKNFKFQQRDTRDSDDKLSEIIKLSTSINLKINKSEIIILSNPQPGTLINKGNIDKVKNYILNNKTDLVVINFKLSPIQQRNLEKLIQVKVIDRTNLILEIFGKRAASHAGRLQVELAHLIYQKSRLIRSWTHLERQRGGLGFIGGPGESQLEIDKRLINQRIKKIKKDLINVTNTRTLQKNFRKKNNAFSLVFVGYTNAGKSTLFNRLSDSKVESKDQLFSTLDPTSRKLKLQNGENIILTDTVGFVSDLPTELISSFHSTLEEVLYSDLIIHVRDLNSNNLHEDSNTVYKTLKEVGLNDFQIENKVIEVFNKVDLFNDEYLVNNKITISAYTGEGLNKLILEIEKKLNKNFIVKNFKIPSKQFKLMSWLYKNSFVINYKFINDNNYLIKAKISKINLEKYNYFMEELNEKNY